MRGTLLAIGALAAVAAGARGQDSGTRRLLYVASPGIRNYTEFGGVGVLVFDIDAGHRFVRRLPTWPERPGEPVENVKGVCASASLGRLYVSTIKRLGCWDLSDGRKVWEKELPGGVDRMSLTPDGKTLFVPSLEGPHWNVVDAASGELRRVLVTNSGAHNTICGLNGREAYLAGLKSPLLYVADAKTLQLSRTVGPFSAAIRPFTVNGAQTRVFVNVNELLGFEVGDLRSGRRLYRVETPGFTKGPTKRHGCPSHGVGLTPDERELWVVDAFNERVHFFDNTVEPPQYRSSLKLREQPGWVTFSLDGKYGYPSTGEVVDVKTHRIVATLADEQNRPVHSEKMLEIDFRDGKPVRAGDQFGLGRRR